MCSKNQQNFTLSLFLFLLFVSFTIFVKFFDVKPTGILDSKVGFFTINVAINQFFKNFIFGTTFSRLSSIFEIITDLFLSFSLLIAVISAMLGVVQLINRKLDKRIFLLGLFYFLVIICYLFFEKVVINYRPILVNGKLEPSFPSSHTLIVCCILESSLCLLKNYIQKIKFFMIIKYIFRIIIISTILLRFFSGVHWFTDIVGGILLALSLVEFYKTLSDRIY